ncbi:MAG: hypothetical protein V3V06_08705, partial [Dehalococcoidia bacterium]
MRGSWRKRVVVLIGLGVVALLVAAACSDANEDDGRSAAAAAEAEQAAGVTGASEDGTAEEQAVSAAPAEDEAAVGGTGLRNGLPEYNFAAAVFNAYWYSRYTLGSLVMMSGLGVTFAPPPEAVQGMVQAVDQGPAEGEHVMVPSNPALLRAVFAGGDPQFVNAFNGDPGDLSNFRWDPAKMNVTITPAAQAQTMIKELEWAKFFNTPGWAGQVSDAFGAMDRFKGMLMYAGAAQQALFALEHLRNAEGFFVAAARFEDGAITVVDPTVQPGDQYQMLQALSDLRLLLQNADRFNGVYNNPELQAAIAAATDELFTKVLTLQPEGIYDLGLGAQAAAWFAAATQDPERQRQAFELLADLGDQLLAADRVGVVDRARAIRGLLEAGRVLEDGAYRDGALADLDALLAAYHVETGHFDGLTTIADWEVGDILGALNSSLVNGGPSVDRPRVQQTYAGFFEAVVNIGGLLQAVIPKELEASPFEIERIGQDLFF